MVLTGKAKEDFLKWCRQDATWIQTYEDIFIHSLIIDWLDSVGVYISIGYRLDYDHWTLKVETLTGSDYERGYLSRHEATKQAIIKANEIYNKRGN